MLGVQKLQSPPQKPPHVPRKSTDKKPATANNQAAVKREGELRSA